MPQILKLLTRLLPALFWLFIVLTTILMLMELKPQPAGYIYADKIQHAFIFMVLTLCGLLAYRHNKWLVLSGLIIFGIMIELLQSVYTLTRQASLADWIADLVGIALAISMIALAKTIVKRVIYVKKTI